MTGIDAHLQGAWVYPGRAWSDLRTAERELLGKQPSYDIVDFAVGFEGEGWGIELFVKNAFDERARSSRFTECSEFKPFDPDNEPAPNTVPLCGLQPYTVIDQPAHRRAHVLEEVLMTAPGQGRPPFPPFTRETAPRRRVRPRMRGIRAIRNACRSRIRADSAWRNRAEFFAGRPAIVDFLRRKWARELDYRLIKEVWAFDGARIAVRFAYEWHDDSGHWFRSYGNENWEFDELGLMRKRHASINDLPIREEERLFRWELGRRPDDHPGLSASGL